MPYWLTSPKTVAKGKPVSLSLKTFAKAVNEGSLK
jgi:hypothetical protein